MPYNTDFYVYTLAYPDETVFYVGKGKKGRITMHESAVRRGDQINQHVARIIKEIWASGEQVKRKKLATFTSEQEAYLYEIALIFFLPGLVNLTNGGSGISGWKMNTSKLAIPDGYVTSNVACQFLGVCRNTLQRYMTSGDIPYSKIGTQQRAIYKRADLEALKEPKPKG